MCWYGLLGVMQVLGVWLGVVCPLCPPYRSTGHASDISPASGGNPAARPRRFGLRVRAVSGIPLRSLRSSLCEGGLGVFGAGSVRGVLVDVHEFLDVDLLAV